MTLRAFTQVHIYEKPPAPKEKDRSAIHCLECCDRNVYVGTRDSTVQHLVLPDRPDGGLEDPGQTRAREGRARRLGSSGTAVAQLRAIPVLNHLLVLWDRSVSAFNMFSLEPLPALKKLQHVSLFEVRRTPPAAGQRSDAAELVTASSRRKVARVYLVAVDRWECVREVALSQDPVAMALDGTCLCLATSDRYLLRDHQTGAGTELFPHGHGRQSAIVSAVGGGEFLLNGPGSLGMFVMKTGVSQRPPLPWPQEVLAAHVCFPYVLVLQPQGLSVYSLLDQGLKQTVGLDGAKGLLSTPDGVLAFTDRDVFMVSLVALEQQIRILVAQDRTEEAMSLLDGVRTRLPLDSYKDLHKTITCMAGFAQFYQEGFSEAKDLFIQGELDPREVIGLYPDMEPGLREALHSQTPRVGCARDLRVLRREDPAAFQRYLGFLGDFLGAVRGTERGRGCGAEVDGALLTLYAQQGATEPLRRLVEEPNSCRLDLCVPVLERHERYFALGSLYQSHGKHRDAIQTWVSIADGRREDGSCPDVYGHVVRALGRLADRDAVWEFTDWALRRNQEIGVQVFTKRPAGDHDNLPTEDVLGLLDSFPVALRLYLEFLIYHVKSEEESHHTRLALAYVTQAARPPRQDGLSDGGAGRRRLQRLLWDSSFYDAAAVYEHLEPTVLHAERAILLGRAGDHAQALHTLVHQEADPRAAEAYCHRAAQGRSPEVRQALLLALLHLHLSSGDQTRGATTAAVDLLNRNPQALGGTGEVLQLLPGSWSVQLVSRFLTGALRDAFHRRRMGGVQRGLAQAELLRHQAMRTQPSRTMVRLQEGQRCGACQGALTEPRFSCSPAGELLHTRCSTE